MRVLSLLTLAIFLTACGSDGGGGVAVNLKKVDLVSFEKDGGAITEVTINEDTPLTGVRLVITGSRSDAEFYEFTTESSNPTLVPNENIVITGTDKFRDLTVTPALNQFGTTTISGVMTNTKTGLSKSTSIDLVVLPINDLPNITADTSVSLTNGLTAASQTVVFSIADVDSVYVAGNITTTGFSAAELTVGSISAAATESEFSFLVTSKDFVAGDTTLTISVTDPDAEDGQLAVTHNITVSVSNSDSDTDSIPDYRDNCPAVVNADQANSDTDPNGNACDTDDDNDAVLDVNDAYPLVSLGGLVDTDGDGRPNTCDATCVTAGMAADADDDNDGLLDANDAYPLVSIGGRTDTDGDGAPDSCDATCLTAGMSADTDDDNDGVADANDAYPLVSLGGLTDTDGDGRPDECDAACVAAGMAADTDDDNDGVLDVNDAYPLVSLGGLVDTDGDGRPNTCDATCVTAGMAADTDDDGDGVLDVNDAFPLISLGGLTDTDGDGAPDSCDATCVTAGMSADTDDDNDGVADANDAYPLIPLNGLTDTDGDGRPDSCDATCVTAGMAADTDDDNDGVLDVNDAYPLISLGGLTDTDGDGIPNECDAACLTAGMTADTDDDNDGVLDVNDAYPIVALGGLVDTDGDGRPDTCDATCVTSGMAVDTDDDNDGVLDVNDAYPLISLGGLTDTDGDGQPDECDVECQAAGMSADNDDDNDGVLDENDAFPLISLDGRTDSDGDGIPDICDAVCRATGMYAEDNVSPVLAVVTPVTVLTADTTPSFVFSSTEAGDITYGGLCAAELVQAGAGSNAINFSVLSEGVYKDCTIVVTDISGNASAPLAVNAFEVQLGSGIIVTNGISGDFTAMRILEDGNILVGANAVARYTHDGRLDLIFNGDGIANLAGTTAFGQYSQVSGATFQADGKYILTGDYRVTTLTDLALSRYNTDGSRDTSFDSDGILTTDFLTWFDNGYAVTVQADEKIIAVGRANTGGNSDFGVARYLTSGVLDTTFGSDGKVTTAIGSSHDIARAVFEQTDEKILVAGSSATQINFVDYYDFALVRYNSNGELDTNFSGDGKVTVDMSGTLVSDGAISIAVGNDEKIVVIGNAGEGFGMVRLNSNGNIDTSFGLNGKVIDGIGGAHIYAVEIQSDGKVIVSGTDQAYSDVVLVRYNVDGSLDSGFGNGGIVTLDLGINPGNAYSLATLDDGKILVSGTHGSGIFLTRFEINGELDSSFALTGLTDSDSDGVPDVNDAYPDISLDGLTDTDGDGIPNECDAVCLTAGMTADTDDDNDGILDVNDAYPTISIIGLTDTDGDGAPDSCDAACIDAGMLADADDDNDGVLDINDAYPLITLGGLLDTDGDGIPNECDITCIASGMLADLDDDNDGVLDIYDAYPLITLGGLTDTDGDGLPNECDAACLTAGMTADTDDDNDGILDVNDAYPVISITGFTDTDGDGAPDGCDAACIDTGMLADADDDNDGVLDVDDAYPLITLGGLTDTDGDGIPNECDISCIASGMLVDLDDDNDGVLDIYDGYPLITLGGLTDTDGDGHPNECDAACVSAGMSADPDDDNDGVLDVDDTYPLISLGGRADTDFDGIPDICDAACIALGMVADDMTAPILAMVTPVSTLTGDETPSYTFSTTEAGEISYGGACSSATTSAVVGDNAINFNTLNEGIYNNCTITLTDVSGNTSNVLLVNNFEVQFGPGFVTTDSIGLDEYGNSVVMQSDGKILVAGSRSNGSNIDFALVRYNSDLTLDSTFSGDGIAFTAIGSSNDTGTSVILQNDGKILLAGFIDVGSARQFALARYNANGSLDNTFSGDGMWFAAIGSYDLASGIALQSDGKILIAGRALIAGNGSDYTVVRFNTNGSLDTTFSGDGKVTTQVYGSDFASSITLQSDDKILVAGYVYNTGLGIYDFGLVRYNSNGSLDTTFSGDGMVITDIGSTSRDYASSITLQGDGKILVAGSSYNGSDGDFALIRYNVDGSLDTDFSSDGKVITDMGSLEDSGNDVVLQSDGKIIVVGSSIVGGFNDIALARYNSDGSLDTDFSIDGLLTTAIGAADDFGASVTVQIDGKIVVAGSSFNGTDYDFAVVRYNTDGSLDTTVGLNGLSDADNDGVLGVDDAFPNNIAASVDADNDGYPDEWNAACDLLCQAGSGLLLDMSLNDSDNDGVINANDDFPFDPAEISDTDNDGVGDNADAFPDNPASSVDVDDDSLPDEWNASCNATCQSGSGLVLDGLLNDTDNDGANNDNDAFPLDATESMDANNNGLGDNSEAVYDAKTTVGYDSDYDKAKWRTEPDTGSWDQAVFQ